MPQAAYIDPENRLPPAEDYNFLRATGIKLIEKLSGKIWTNYNTHDPGITLLEALCYSITDLAYRTSFDIKDLLASGVEPGEQHKDFLYTAREIFPCGPVTITDYRKVILDITGVKNAWIEQCSNAEVPLYFPAILHYPSTAHITGQLSYEAQKGDLIASTPGLYKVMFEYAADVRSSAERQTVMLRIMNKLHSERALCEDFISILPVEYDFFGMEAELKVIDGSDIDRIAGQVFSLTYDFFSPEIKFYSLEQMLKKGYSAEEIFEGPPLENGFIDTAELNQSERYRNVHQSDIVNLLSGIDGLVAVKQCAFISEYGSSYSDFSRWINDVRARGKMPQLDLNRCSITFVRTSDRHRTPTQNLVNAENVRAIYKFLQSENKQSGLRQFAEDITIPQGEDMNVSEYVPMLHDLPRNYGLQERIVELDKDAQQLDQMAISKFQRHFDDLGAAERKQVDRQYKLAYLEGLKPGSRQALQLKGFLLVFEQIMADYLSQLAHLKALFSFKEDAVKTYFPQILKNIHDLETLMLNISEEGQIIPLQTETETGFSWRRDRVLNHLLARFGENMDFYGNDLKAGDPILNRSKLIAKTDFMRDYINVSTYRGTGPNYKTMAEGQNALNVAGLKKRLCRLLGIKDYSNRYCTSDGINIVQRQHADGSERYVVVVGNAAGEVLLSGAEVKQISIAGEVLISILNRGSIRTNYDIKRVEKDFAYELTNGNPNETDTVASGRFNTQEKMETSFGTLVQYLESIALDENFHLLEHLLLRPKVKGTTLLKTPGELLNSDQPFESEEMVAYSFSVATQPDVANGGTIWKLKLGDGARDVLYTEDDFIFESHLNKRIENIRSIAAEPRNYQLEQDTAGTYTFRIVNGSKVLAVSAIQYPNIEEREQEIQHLAKFFSFELTLKPPGAEEFAAGHYAFPNPYAFQVSIFIPNWPRRFRDPSFMHLLEKAIYLETPAHIYAHVYWLDYMQMKTFEQAYEPWLKTLADDEIPDVEIVNKLVQVINDLNS
jgi:hypothetical protein